MQSSPTVHPIVGVGETANNRDSGVQGSRERVSGVACQWCARHRSSLTSSRTCEHPIGLRPKALPLRLVPSKAEVFAVLCCVENARANQGSFGSIQTDFGANLHVATRPRATQENIRCPVRITREWGPVLNAWRYAVKVSAASLQQFAEGCTPPLVHRLVDIPLPPWRANNPGARPAHWST